MASIRLEMALRADPGTRVGRATRRRRDPHTARAGLRHQCDDGGDVRIVTFANGMTRERADRRRRRCGAPPGLGGGRGPPDHYNGSIQVFPKRRLPPGLDRRSAAERPRQADRQDDAAGMDAMKKKLEADVRRRPNDAAIGWWTARRPLSISAHDSLSRLRNKLGFAAIAWNDDGMTRFSLPGPDRAKAETQFGQGDAADAAAAYRGRWSIRPCATSRASASTSRRSSSTCPASIRSAARSTRRCARSPSARRSPMASWPSARARPAAGRAGCRRRDGAQSGAADHSVPPRARRGRQARRLLGAGPHRDEREDARARRRVHRRAAKAAVDFRFARDLIRKPLVHFFG